MGTRRADRIARADADQLLAGQPGGTPHAGLAALLSEAAAPPRPVELAGEAEAVAAFRRLRSATPTMVDLSTVDVVPGGGRRRTAGPPWRGATIRLAVAVLLLAIAGTASITLAYRPARLQPTPTPVASSSIPAPSPSPSASGLRRPPTLTTPRTTSPSLAPSPAAVSTGVGDLALATQLCQEWAAATDKATRDQVAELLGPLIDRLDGPNGLPAFCRKLVNAQPTATATASATVTTAKAAKAAKATPAFTKSQVASKRD